MTRRKNITISKKYGLNPSLTRCICCGAEVGIALFGNSWKDKNGKEAEAPREVAMGLCDKCQSVVDQGGMMIIEVRDGETGDNPYRTGRIVGMTKDFKERNNFENPIMYMEQKLFSQLFDNYLKETEEGDDK